MEHTAEPWYLGGTPFYLVAGQQADGEAKEFDPITIRSPHHTEEIATVWTYLLPTEANARRIVAAVNACMSIPTEALENGLIPQLRRIANAARAIYEVSSGEKDECPHGYWPTYHSPTCWCPFCFDELKDALAALDQILE